MTGFILLGISIFFGLSGYLLLWDERAFAAVRVATGGAGAFPFIGWFIKAFLRGSIDVTGDTLIRFYAFHVAILPIITLGLIGLHILLVQYHGMSVPLSLQQEKQREIPFFPNVFYKDLAIWLVVTGVLVTLTVFLPPEIGVKADPLAPPPENVKPEWYFLFLMQTLKLFPGSILGLNGETIAIVLVAARDPLFLSHPLFRQEVIAGREEPALHVDRRDLSSLFPHDDGGGFFQLRRFYARDAASSERFFSRFVLAFRPGPIDAGGPRPSSMIPAVSAAAEKAGGEDRRPSHGSLLPLHRL